VWCLDADVAARVGWFLGVGIGLLAAGLLLVAGGVVLIGVAARWSPRRPAGSGILRFGPVANDPRRRRGSTPKRDKRDEATHY
jgi:hypothetical protein